MGACPTSPGAPSPAGSTAGSWGQGSARSCHSRPLDFDASLMDLVRDVEGCLSGRGGGGGGAARAAWQPSGHQGEYFENDLLDLVHLL